MADFVHLHLHTEYSLLDGACRISQLVDKIKANNQTSVAITDHGVLYGAIAFDDACRKAGIHPVIGCEVYVSPTSRFDKNPNCKYEHLILLCENNTGYRNLCKLVSLGFTEGFYSRPRVDDELLAKYHEGLIALSACIAGRIPRLLSVGNIGEAKENALKYQKLFGKDRFYIEIQNHNLAVEKALIPQLASLALECDIPLVATNDCHYPERQDAETQNILMCIQTGSLLSEGRPEAFATDEFYVKSTNEMEMLFRSYPEALENTERIAKRCNVEFDFTQTHLPQFPCPDHTDSSLYLKKLAYEGFDKRKFNRDIVYTAEITEQKYQERMMYELSVIEKMGYSDYFLIVQDYVNFAKDRQIPVGPGRGSGCGSLVAFCLGITDIDPLKFDLLFERFLNPERVSMPDIDMDFCYIRRDEVIQYVKQKYGDDHVSQIITFGTLSARAVIRDVGRVLGMTYGDVDAVAKLIPQELDITIDTALKSKDLQAVYESNPDVKKLIDIAKKLEGMPRNVSVHAAGVLITEKPLTDYLPLSLSGDTVITQFDMDTVAKLGLLKFDFLALRYLTILDDAKKMILRTNKTFDLDRIPLNDEKTYRLIASGKTSGVFQLESAGMKSMLQNLKPDCLDDIIAAIALYRPGPMDFIPKYIEGHSHKETITYAHPLLKPILEGTNGVIVYQEQVMQIFRTLGGYSFGHADIVRRAMAKKKRDVLLSERECFVSGAVTNGVTKEIADKLFSDMESFADYAFNKSHATAYAVISYRTAYLKANYPREYFSALLTSVLSRPDKIAEYISECESVHIHVLPPDVNRSGSYFETDGENIRFGLLAIKGVGGQFLKDVFLERNKHLFTSFDDFIDRMPSGSVNKKMVEALIKSGAFDTLGKYRSQLLSVAEEVIAKTQDKARLSLNGQMDFFSTASDLKSEGIVYPNLEEFPKRTLLQMEKEATGFTFSGSYLDDYTNHIASLSVSPIAYYTEENANSARHGKVTIVGIISNVTKKVTKKGEEMAFLTLEDRSGDMECIIFPKTYSAMIGLLRPYNALCLTGELQEKEDEKPKLLVNNAMELILNDLFHKEKIVYIRVNSTKSDIYQAVENDVQTNGEWNVIIYDSSRKEYKKTNRYFTNEQIEKWREKLGKDNVITKEK